MTSDRKIWDGAYERRGQLWSGTPPSLSQLPDQGRVLELGCGNGKMFPALFLEGRDLIGLDFSHAAAREARTRIPATSSGTIVLADARALPFIPCSFNAIIARHIIGHMDNSGREQIASQVTRVLCPRGTLHFSGFSDEDFRYGKGMQVGEGTFLRGNGICTHYFTGDEVRTLFSDLSCSSLEIRQWILRIRGKEHTRSEIHATFMKGAE